MTNCLICGNSLHKSVITAIDFSNSGEEFNISECSQCHFRFTSNPPAEASCGHYYKNENYISHSNTKKGFIARLYHIVRNIMLHRKYNLLTKLSNKTYVLDIGSGTGYFLNYLNQKGYQVQGVEISDSAREFSIKEFKLDVKKSIDEIITKTPFDFITLWHVLEHLYDPDRYMSKFKNLLNKDGILIIALPNYDSYDGKKYEKFWAGYDVPRHLWHFTPATFQQFAIKNGFTVISKHIMPFDPFYNALLSEKYKKNNLSIVRGFLTGLFALIKGLRDTDKASSVIYILKHTYNTSK